MSDCDVTRGERQLRDCSMVCAVWRNVSNIGIRIASNVGHAGNKDSTCFPSMKRKE